MSKLFIKRISSDLYTICYKDKDGKSKAYEENWNPVHFTTEQKAVVKLSAIESERNRADAAIALSDEEVRSFVAKQYWTFAKTCEKTNPHEYVVKANLNDSSQKRFERFVATIKANGEIQS